jgi:uncharacterized protein (TIGR02271 family)
MSRQQQFRVTDRNGVRAALLTTSRFLDDNPHRLVRLEDGRELLVPKQLLRPQDDGSFTLAASIHELMGDGSRPPEQHAYKESSHSKVEDTEHVVPVMQEELDIEKRVVESGRIRINKRIETTESVVDEPLLQHSYDIQRTAVNRIIDDPPTPHYDGDTLVLPVIEEVLVVEKRLILREEVRITPKREEVRDPQTHTVRREHVEVERV